MKNHYDVIIIGAGAAGLFCAAQVGQAGRSVLLLEHANKVGKKILMSGGGHCNFTNYEVSSEQYLSHNPHFCKSALSQYSQWDFIALIEAYAISYHEKKEGQLFCDEKARLIVDMLLNEVQKGKGEIRLKTAVSSIKKTSNGFQVKAGGALLEAENLVMATGGPSIPSLGASDFGYQIAQQFGLKLYPPRAALVPFVLTDNTHKQMCEQLAGSAFKAAVRVNKTHFVDDVLITHRGLSGPAILQISSYWKTGDSLWIDMLPDISVQDYLADLKIKQPKLNLQKWLATVLSHKLANYLLQLFNIQEKQLANIAQDKLFALADRLNNWHIKPAGTEGYRTAEVALGGVDTNELSSKTMQVKKYQGLYFIGELIDVTGHLGGYNFQWAWSSAMACAKGIIADYQ